MSDRPNKISSLVRQVRYRAKQHECVNRLELPAVLAVFADFDNKCAYCNAAATTIDQPFLIANKAPNVAANCLPCCNNCRTRKRNLDLIAFHLAGHLTKSRLVGLLTGMLARDGGDDLREYMRRITGYVVAADELPS